jgi:pimeloyl-ACP methyl ester carboxylesterase
VIGNVLKFAAVLAIAVSIYWTFLFFTQRRVLFPAPISVGAPARPPDAQQVWLPGREGDTEAWFLPPLIPAKFPVPLLIFGHGNGELIDYWPDAFDEPRRWGMAVMLVEYPGYGRSAGQPSERTIREAFRAAYDWAATEAGVDASRIVGYGRSLGGGAVGLLSRDRSLAAMVLESSFTSTRQFSGGFGAPGFLVRDPFDNVAAVRAFDGPLLIIHGAHDRVVPLEHGRTLASIGNVQLHVLPCGHNDCPRSWPLIREFLAGERIVPSQDRDR